MEEGVDPARVWELEIEDDAQLYGVLARLERLAISIVSFEPAGGQAKQGV